MSLDLTTASSTASDIVAAKQADYVAFLHRVPFAADALALGYLPGFREDCGYQADQYLNLEIPVGMLDNDFRNPNLERFVDRFFEHEPEVGVIGDIYELDAVDAYVAAAREIQASYPEAQLIVVPKCQAVIDEIPQDLVLGYSRGYADRLAHEFSDPADWRGDAYTSSAGVRTSSSLVALTPDSVADSVTTNKSWTSTGDRFGVSVDTFDTVGAAADCSVWDGGAFRFRQHTVGVLELPRTAMQNEC